MKISLGFLLIFCLVEFSCHKMSSVTNTKVETETQAVTQIKQKIKDFKKIPARVEVRNYLRKTNSKYQEHINQVKKIKTRLDPKSEVYLEINLFTNEDDQTAPLVAQFMWFDIKTQNLILEENLNLE